MKIYLVPSGIVNRAEPRKAVKTGSGYGKREAESDVEKLTSLQPDVNRSKERESPDAGECRVNTASGKRYPHILSF
jgi:hypothetical protein